MPTNICLFCPHRVDINKLNMICHAVNVDKKKTHTHISSLIYFFLLDSDYVAFCFPCKYCILLSRWLHCNFLFSFVFLQRWQVVQRPRALKGSLLSIKVSVNLTFDLPAVDVAVQACLHQVRVAAVGWRVCELVCHDVRSTARPRSIPHQNAPV